MAGKKGRSGGARPGAGRKPKQTVEIAPEVAKVADGEPLDPRPTLELIALGHMAVSPQQLKALTALLPYVHAKKGAGAGKPEAPAKPETSRYGVRQGPRLAAAGGKQL
jgi:phage terminase small subunit